MTAIEKPSTRSDDEDRARQELGRRMADELSAEYPEVAETTIHRLVSDHHGGLARLGAMDDATWDVVRIVTRADLRALTSIRPGRSAEGRGSARL